jgi:hypothetical protein
MKPMNEGIEMNPISLKKVTLIVSTCALASYFVSAKESELNLDFPVAEVSSVKDIATKAAEIDNLKNSTGDISEFLAKFDLDKNSLLNKAEMLASKNVLLSENFENIDKNVDKEISKEELENYLSEKTALKTKISDLVEKS